VAAGVWLWVNRDRGSDGKKAAGEAGSGSAELTVAAEARFDEARKQLAEGRFVDAAQTFRTLYEQSRLPEPKNSWAAVHHGLAEYLAERPEPARLVLKTVSERVAPTAIGMDAKLVAFLNRLSVIAQAKGATADVTGLDGASYESLAYLVAGLEQWSVGSFDQGAALLRQFHQAAPADESAWVAGYRPLVANYLTDHGNFSEIAEALKKVNAEPEAAEAALKKIPDVRSRLRSRELIRGLDALENESGGKVKAALAAAKEATMKKQAEAEAREERLLTDAKLQLKDLCENYRFTEAAAVIRGVNVKLGKFVAERDLVAQRVDWLVEFKQQLISDLNAAGCSVHLLKKNGQKLSGTASRADDQQFELRVQFGTLPGVKWSEISPPSVLQMARAYMKPALPPAVLADREWRAGVFCLFTQLAEGQVLIDEAATRKPEYQTDRALLLGQTAPSPAPDSAPAPADNAASGTPPPRR